MASPRTAPAFVAWLAGRYPAVEKLRREHIADNEELLPHVLFGDVTRYAADLARGEGDLAVPNDLLNDLDSALGAEEDDEVANLIWVSFVENAQGVPGDDEEALREQLRRFPAPRGGAEALRVRVRRAARACGSDARASWSLTRGCVISPL